MTRRRTTATAVTAALGAAVLAITGLAGCSGNTGAPTAPQYFKKLSGDQPQEINLVAPQTWVEDGTLDGQVDWVTPFEQRTGCTVNIKTTDTEQDAVALMANPKRTYDGVLAGPEVAGQLMSSGQAGRIDTSRVQGYGGLQAKLRALTVRDGQTYGVPVGWTADTIVYHTGKAGPAPTGYAALFSPAAIKAHPNGIVMRNSPLVLADAALYLKATAHRLGITDPYELTSGQLAAAAAVIKAQQPAVQVYWQKNTKAVTAFAAWGSAVGMGQPYVSTVLAKAGRPIRGVVPAEGLTGSVYQWLLGARAAHPNCMYQWLSWVATPDVQLQTARWNGVAAANPAVCAEAPAGFCAAYHVDDSAFIGRVRFATAPGAACPKGSTCTGYAQWEAAWTKATG